MNKKLLGILLLIPFLILSFDGCKRARNNPYDLNYNPGDNDTTGTPTGGTSYRIVLVEEFTSTG